MEGVTREDFQDREIGKEKHWVGILKEKRLEETNWGEKKLGITWYLLYIKVYI